MKESPEKPDGEKRVVIYIETDAALKDRLSNLAKKRRRKISAEAILAIEKYLDEEEPKEGITETAKPKEKKGK
ncbi:MAG: hypothetical protein ACJ8FY_09735 [Gemmataceae bacterium]